MLLSLHRHIIVFPYIDWFKALNQFNVSNFISENFPETL